MTTLEMSLETHFLLPNIDGWDGKEGKLFELAYDLSKEMIFLNIFFACYRIVNCA